MSQVHLFTPDWNRTEFPQRLARSPRPVRPNCSESAPAFPLARRTAATPLFGTQKALE